eukprot:TRINITY_DN1386_c0_g4_i1.p1 TRINITY_DN1386_c0_g4~~TRINITY_DN1386_c0_g4_i1.p1  ORF type:complete len:311 (-),score=22.91 TRINITY_DN1386_c0_g4_i1:121-1017(-)
MATQEVDYRTIRTVLNRQFEDLVAARTERQKEMATKDRFLAALLAEQEGVKIEPRFCFSQAAIAGSRMKGTANSEEADFDVLVSFNVDCKYETRHQLISLPKHCRFTRPATALDDLERLVRAATAKLCPSARVERRTVAIEVTNFCNVDLDLIPACQLMGRYSQDLIWFIPSRLQLEQWTSAGKEEEEQHAKERSRGFSDYKKCIRLLKCARTRRNWDVSSYALQRVVDCAIATARELTLEQVFVAALKLLCTFPSSIADERTGEGLLAKISDEKKAPIKRDIEMALRPISIDRLFVK